MYLSELVELLGYCIHGMIGVKYIYHWFCDSVNVKRFPFYQPLTTLTITSVTKVLGIQIGNM